MSIIRLSAANPYNQSIQDIDNNEFILNGLINQARFNKNEIDAIYEDTGISRKYRILSGAGNSAATYTNWTHITAESGYSIWKIPYTEFKHNAYNEMYLDDVSLTYKGSANQEAYTAFDKVFVYTSLTYSDATTEAATESGVAITLMDASIDYLYVGLSTVFSAVDFDFNIKGANYTLKAEYYNGATWTQFTLLSNKLVDNTNNLRTDGRVEFDIPTNWAQTTINSSNSMYFVRFSSTTTPVTVATAYSIFPGNSVYSLLQLSSTNIFNEEWSWCYFNNGVYVTIRNTGTPNYEGDTYISSSSSATNKQNYFVSNHTYKVTYEKTDYKTGAMFTPTYGFRWYNTGSSINIINWSNTTPFKLTNTRSTALAIKIEAGTNDTTTGASTGSDGAVPAKVAKYLAIDIDGTTYKIPLFNA